jgi:hypothetical protein
LFTLSSVETFNKTQSTQVLEASAPGFEVRGSSTRFAFDLEADLHGRLGLGYDLCNLDLGNPA